MSTPPVIVVKNTAGLKKVVKEYSQCHVMGTSALLEKGCDCIVDIKKVKEYTQIYRSLNDLHIGLGNSLHRMQELVEEGVLPPLFQKCIRYLCTNTETHSKILYHCISSPLWNFFHISLQLMNVKVLLLTQNGLEWQPYTTTIYKDFHTSKGIIPLSLQIPLLHNTHSVLSFHPSFGKKAIAMGLIECTSQKRITKVLFLYTTPDKTYKLQNSHIRILIGRNYPLKVTREIKEFWNKVHISFQDLPETHSLQIIESLVELLNPSLG